MNGIDFLRLLDVALLNLNFISRHVAVRKIVDIHTVNLH